jgi:PAS domain S-box-containing protein
VVPIGYEGQQAFLLILIDITERKTAEEKLLISEKKFSSAFKASPTLITITTLEEGTFIDVNDTFVRVTGYRREDVIGKPSRSMSLIPYPEDRKKLAYMLKRDGFVENEITKYRTRTGEDRIGYFSANTIELQERPCVLSVVSDVTELKKVEEALRESEIRYRELVELLPQVICETDMEGNLTFSNRVGFEMTGYTPEDMGRGINILDLLVPDDRERAVAGMISLFQQGYQGGHEYTILRKDGTTFPSIIYSDIIENEGKPVGVRSIVIDITRRKNAEAELRKREEQLMDISRNMPGVIYQFYFKKWEEWGFNYISEKSREILGLENNPDDFYVRFINRVPEATAIDMIRTLRRAIRDNREWDYETEFVKPDGQTIWIVLMASPAQYESEVLYNGFCFDITEQKNASLEREKLEGQLRQAQKMEAIGRLAGGIAHDFNNLLTAIIGNADMAMDFLDEKEPPYENIEDISLTAQRAAGLTRQLLAFSKKQIIAPTPLNLNDIIHAVERMLQRIIGEDIEMNLYPGKELWNIKADPSQLEQLIFNLVVNSRDAMPEGGKLDIETGNRELDEDFLSENPGSSPGPHVELTVRDTGTGMTDEVKDKIFEPFFTTKGEMGTGLGLSIVYGIVQQNSGFVQVASEPGEGTVFTIYFPAVKEGPAVRTEKRGEEKLPRTSRGERILILEDEDAVRKLAVRALQESGYEILEASNGQDALELCREREDEIDLILSDVVVPGLSGPDLVDTIRETCPEMKAIFMSGYAENSISKDGILRDDIHFIPKPFRPVELVKKVREVLDEK